MKVFPAQTDRLGGGLRLGSVVALLAVVGCANPKLAMIDPELKEYAGAAAACCQQGDVNRAGELYHKALQRARLTDDADEIMRNAYNLALCYMTAGDISKAGLFLNQAEGLAKGVDLARILLARAELMKLAGNSVESGHLAKEAVMAGADREGLVQAALLQAESELTAGQYPAALTNYREADCAMNRQTPPLLKARAEAVAIQLVKAKILEANEAELHVRHAEWLKEARQFKSMAEALVMASSCYERELDWKRALTCRVRAAQSMMAAGARETALPLLIESRVLAEKTGDRADVALVEALMGEQK